MTKAKTNIRDANTAIKLNSLMIHLLRLQRRKKSVLESVEVF